MRNYKDAFEKYLYALPILLIHEFSLALYTSRKIYRRIIATKTIQCCLHLQGRREAAGTS
jgi:hypothetical protein